MDFNGLYPVHPKTRRFSFEIMRKLSVTWSRKSRRCFGMVSRKNRRSLGELFLGCVESVAGPVAGNVLVHHCPQALNRVEVRTAGRQLDQVDAAIGARELCAHIWPAMTGRIVPDDRYFAFMDFALFGVSRLNSGLQLHRTFAINGGGVYKRPVEVFQVHRTVDIDPPAPRCLAECRV